LNKHHRLSVDSIRKMFLETCLAIKHIHENNYIHRDLKPENVILRNQDDPYDVVMVDFGFTTKVADVK